jgi:signal transduction histidine kinase
MTNSARRDARLFTELEKETVVPHSPSRGQKAVESTPEFLRGTFDALSARVAVIDYDGTIVATNRAWDRFADDSGLAYPDAGRGSNYLAVCDRATGPFAEGADRAASGIRAVISGQGDYFELEYPCPSAGRERWFAARVSRFQGAGLRYALVAHEDITEQRQLRMIELEHLRATNAAKDEFIGLVSHELKSPITTIRGNAELLRRRAQALSPAEQQRILADIERDADRTGRVIEDLLTLARLERGVEIELEPVPIERLVQRVVDDFAHKFHAQVRLLGAGAGILVEGSPLYLEQVVQNLLSNARKYGGEGGIDVEIRAAGVEIEVSVLDRGAGIPPDDVERVFEPFYRSRAQARPIEGIGLGLTLCKRLVEAQHGRVWARPRAGGGTDVGFALRRLS